MLARGSWISMQIARHDDDHGDDDAVTFYLINCFISVYSSYCFAYYYSPQVSRTLLSILAEFNNAIDWTVPSSPLMTVPKTPIIIAITATFMLHSFFCSLARSRYLSFFSLSFNYYYLLFESFSYQRLLMFIHWSLSDSKSPQVSRTLLSILTDLNNVVVWTASTRPVISKSFSPFGDCNKSLD